MDLQEALWYWDKHIAASVKEATVGINVDDVLYLKRIHFVVKDNIVDSFFFPVRAEVYFENSRINFCVKSNMIKKFSFFDELSLSQPHFKYSRRFWECLNLKLRLQLNKITLPFPKYAF